MTYTSAACAFGTHHQCEDGHARPPEPLLGIVFQTCACTCHVRADDPPHQEGTAPCATGTPS